MTVTVIRRAVRADTPAVARLFDRYRQLYGKPADLDAASEFLVARMAKGESAIFVAFSDDYLVGFAQVYPSFSSVSLAPICVLNDLFVSEYARGQGVGHRLVAAAAEYAKSQNAVRMVVSTARANTDAQALYKKVGLTRDTDSYFYEYRLPRSAAPAPQTA